MIRAYLPTTLRGLARVAATGEVAAPVSAHAVTDAVRHEWRESSEEEWEYEALCLAADDCAEIWAESWADGDVRRRVVLAVDLDDADVEPATADDPDPTQVRVTRPVPLRRVAAIHADLSEADAERGDDLCWFATQELDQLLG